MYVNKNMANTSNFGNTFVVSLTVIGSAGSSLIKRSDNTGYLVVSGGSSGDTAGGGRIVFSGSSRAGASGRVEICAGAGSSGNIIFYTNSDTQRGTIDSDGTFNWTSPFNLFNGLLKYPTDSSDRYYMDNVVQNVLVGGNVVDNVARVYNKSNNGTVYGNAAYTYADHTGQLRCAQGYSRVGSTPAGFVPDCYYVEVGNYTIDPYDCDFKVIVTHGAGAVYFPNTRNIAFSCVSSTGDRDIRTQGTGSFHLDGDDNPPRVSQQLTNIRARYGQYSVPNDFVTTLNYKPDGTQDNGSFPSWACTVGGASDGIFWARAPAGAPGSMTTLAVLDNTGSMKANTFKTLTNGGLYANYSDSYFNVFTGGSADGSTHGGRIVCVGNLYGGANPGNVEINAGGSGAIVFRTSSDTVRGTISGSTFIWNAGITAATVQASASVIAPIATLSDHLVVAGSSGTSAASVQLTQSAAGKAVYTYQSNTTDGNNVYYGIDGSGGFGVNNGGLFFATNDQGATNTKDIVFAPGCTGPGTETMRITYTGTPTRKKIVTIFGDLNVTGTVTGGTIVYSTTTSNNFYLSSDGVYGRDTSSLDNGFAVFTGGQANGSTHGGRIIMSGVNRGGTNAGGDLEIAAGGPNGQVKFYVNGDRPYGYIHNDGTWEVHNEDVNAELVPLRALAPFNTGANHFTDFVVGTALSTNNGAKYGFKSQASNSASNQAAIGITGHDDLLLLNTDGSMASNPALTNTSIGSFGFKYRCGIDTGFVLQFTTGVPSTLIGNLTPPGGVGPNVIAQSWYQQIGNLITVFYVIDFGCASSPAGNYIRLSVPFDPIGTPDPVAHPSGPVNPWLFSGSGTTCQITGDTNVVTQGKPYGMSFHFEPGSGLFWVEPTRNDGQQIIIPTSGLSNYMVRGSVTYLADISMFSY